MRLQKSAIQDAVHQETRQAISHHSPKPMLCSFDSRSLTQSVHIMLCLCRAMGTMTCMAPYVFTTIRAYVTCDFQHPDAAYKRSIRTFTHTYLQCADSLSAPIFRLG